MESPLGPILANIFVGFQKNLLFENIPKPSFYVRTAGEEYRQQLHKNVASNIKQVLETAPHRAPTIRPPASHHEQYPS